MALLERLAILITADAAGAISEMKKVAASAEKDLGKAGAEGSKLSTNMTKVGAAMMGAGAGLLAVGVASADTATSLGREVMKLQRYTGMTAEEASKLAFASKMSGVQVDSLAIGLGKLSKSMEAGSPAFDKLGISVKDGDGKLRSMGDLLPELAEKFKTMPNGPEKTATALQLFGRAGMDLMPFLNKGKEGIAELSKEAEKMGLVLSQDNVAQIKAHITSQRELNAAFDGVKTQIGLSMIPVLDLMTNTFKNIPGPVYDVIGPLTVFGGLGLTAAGGISLIVGQLGKLKTIAVDAYGGLKNLMTQIMNAPKTFAVAAAGIALLAAGMYIYQQRLNDAGAAGVKALGDLSGKNVDELKSQLDDVNNKLTELKKNMAPDGAQGLAQLWDVITGKDKDKEALSKQKKALEDAITAASNAAGPAKTLAEAEKAAADETSNHTLAIKNLNDVLNASLDPFLNSIGAAEKVAESERKLTESKQKVFFAQLALTEAIKQYGPKSAEAAKAADDLADAQRGVDSAQATAFKSAIEYEQSIGNLKAQMADHPEIYQQNIDKINAMEAAQQIDAETAERMRRKLMEVAIAAGQIPPTASVKVTADTWDAAWKITDLVTRIETLNRLAHTPGNYNFSSITGNAMGGRVGPGMAMGGRPSSPHLVGELGPEIFWPDSAGTIVTAEKTKQMLSQDSASTVNVYVNQSDASPYEIGKELVWALRVSR